MMLNCMKKLGVLVGVCLNASQALQLKAAAPDYAQRDIIKAVIVTQTVVDSLVQIFVNARQSRKCSHIAGESAKVTLFKTLSDVLGK